MRIPYYPLSRRRFLQGTAAASAMAALSGTRALAATTTVTYWTDSVPGFQSYENDEKLFADFEAANPDIDVQPRRVPSQDFNKQFKAAVAAGEPFDAISVNPQFLRDYALNGLLEDLTPALEPILKERFLPLVIEQSHVFSMSNAIYGLPTQLATCGVYYNKDIFDRFGFAIPETWDDVRAIHKELEGSGIATFVYPGSEPWWNPMWFNAFFYQRTGNNGIAVNTEAMKGNTKFAIDPYIEAIQDFVNLDREGIMIKGSQGLDKPTADGIFQRGEAAMYFQGTWQDYSLRQAGMQNYSVFKFPVISRDVKSEAPGSINPFYSVAASSPNKEAAFKLIQAMAGEEYQQAMASLPGAGISLLKSLQGKSTDPISMAFEEIAPTTVIWLDALWEPEVISAFQQGIQTAVIGSQTPKEVLESIDNLYAELRRDGRTYYK